jgi:EmrB/QacA subfamily drug resistance transporter
MQYKWIALAVTSVGTLMAGIDTRILIVGLPVVAKALGADVNQVIWISQAYLLASTISLLLIGRITDIAGKVRIFVIGFVVFTVGSGLASLSLFPTELIASRVIQGVGAAILISDSAAILTDSTPHTDLGMILGINQVALKVGSLAGLTLSGLILTIADWRALFYINIPIGIVGAIWASKKLREISVKDPARAIDRPGFFLFTGGLTLVLLSSTFFGYGQSFDTRIGIATLVVGTLLLAIFVAVERRVRVPLLDLSLFRITDFAFGNVIQFLDNLAWFGFVVMFTFYMQAVLHYSPLQAGLAFIPLEIGTLAVGPISGRLADKYGPRPFMTIGIIFSTLGLIAASFLTITSGYLQLAGILVLEGLGFGIFFSPNVSSIMGPVPVNRRGVASAFRNIVGNVGLTASAGIAVLIMSIGIPYSSFSALIQSIQPQPTELLNQFVNGFRITCIAFAILDSAAAALAAWPRNRKFLATKKPK